MGIVGRMGKHTIWMVASELPYGPQAMSTYPVKPGDTRALFFGPCAWNLFDIPVPDLGVHEIPQVLSGEKYWIPPENFFLKMAKFRLIFARILVISTFARILTSAKFFWGRDNSLQRDTPPPPPPVSYTYDWEHEWPRYWSGDHGVPS